MSHANHNASRLTALLLAGLGFAVGLNGCGDVDVIATEVQMPAALIESFPADVGVFYDDDLRNYIHTEERWGGKWQVKLGKIHIQMLDKLMPMAFRRTVEIKDLKAPPADAGIGAILRPTIEQYSFITPRDTGGNYYAVTIKYRLDVFAPDGRLADSVTFTGYGSAPVGRMFSRDQPMVRATQVAMRDAAAKFLVQFPDQPVAQRLRAGEPLIQVAAATPNIVEGEETTAAETTEGEEVEIEAVPIIDEQAQSPVAQN